MTKAIGKPRAGEGRNSQYLRTVSLRPRQANGRARSPACRSPPVASDVTSRSVGEAVSHVERPSLRERCCSHAARDAGRRAGVLRIRLYLARPRAAEDPDHACAPPRRRRRVSAWRARSCCSRACSSRTTCGSGGFAGFHAALLLVLLRHLRYLPRTGAGRPSPLVQPSFRHVCRLRHGRGLLAGLGRAAFVERMRYISTPSDHLMLALLSASRRGLAMKFVAHRRRCGEGLLARPDAARLASLPPGRWTAAAASVAARCR